MPKGRRAKAQPRTKLKASRSGGSLRALARLLGVSHTAVEKAIVSGRLVTSVGRTARGRPRILDFQAAVQEWREGGRSNGNGDSQPKAATLAEAQLRVAIQRELKLDLENRRTGGVLIDRAAEDRRDYEIGRTVRDAILNVPDRVAAELAAEMDAGRVHRRLEQELRAALVALAEVIDRDHPMATGALADDGVADGVR